MIRRHWLLLHALVLLATISSGCGMAEGIFKAGFTAGILVVVLLLVLVLFLVLKTRRWMKPR